MPLPVFNDYAAIFFLTHPVSRSPMTEHSVFSLRSLPSYHLCAAQQGRAFRGRVGGYIIHGGGVGVVCVRGVLKEWSD